MKRTVVVTVMFLSLCMLGAISLWAQPPSREMAPENSNGNSKIRNMITWKLIDYLNLTEDQSSKFFPLWKEYTDAGREVRHQRRELYRKIEEGVENTDVSGEELLGLVKELMANEESERSRKQKLYRDSRDILDDRQYVKLIIFEDLLLAELLHDYRRENQRNRPQ